MRHAVVAPLAALMCLVAPALADDEIPPVVGGKTYAQHLAVTAKARHPGVDTVVIEGRRNGEGPIVVLGSTRGAQSVFTNVATPSLRAGGAMVNGRYVSRQPFVSSTGHRLGTITVTFAPGGSTVARDRTAQTIAREIARAVLSGKNAVDPYPYDPGFGPNTYAQLLTEDIVARNPDILVVMLHATPPAGGDNVVIGSNIGRFGKIADEDDLRIINTGATNLEVAGESDDRYETAMPLNDAAGEQIGALGIVFHLTPGADKTTLQARGRAIRDALARKIPDNAALFRPHR